MSAQAKRARESRRFSAFGYRSNAIADGDTVAFIRKQAEGARYVTSVCTGAFLLGAAVRRMPFRWDRLAREGRICKELLLTLGSEVSDAMPARGVRARRRRVRRDK
jgi:putative intracellular protease/amidase